MRNHLQPLEERAYPTELACLLLMVVAEPGTRQDKTFPSPLAGRGQRGGVERPANLSPNPSPLAARGKIAHHFPLADLRYSLAFVSLHQLTIDEDAILLRLKAGEQKLPLFLDRHVMFFCQADDEIVSFGETHRERSYFVYDGNSVNLDFQTARELIEREINPVWLRDADHEAELH